MAVRIHVVAARNTSPAELTAQLAGISTNPPAQQDGWTWAISSVWQASGKELDEALTGLTGPALRCTTEDGVLWRLTLVQGSQRERFKHEFGIDYEELLADYDGDLDEFAAEAALPPETLEALQAPGADPREVLAAHRQRESLQIAAALARFGIPGDKSQVLNVLTGETLGVRDYRGDLGDLPAFLASLGLTDPFAGLVDEEEDLESEADDGTFADEAPDDEEDYEDDEDCVAASAALAREAFATLTALAPVAEPLAEGPLRLGADQLERLALIPWCCDPQTGFGMRLALPPGEVCPIDWRKQPYIEASVAGQQVEWAVTLEAGPGLTLASLRTLAPELPRLPAGTQFELVTALVDDDDSRTAGAHRYTGRIEAGQLIIEAAGPPVSVADLQAALATAALACVDDDEGPVETASAAEAAAVVMAASRNSYFNPNQSPEIDGAHIELRGAVRAFVVMLLLRQRFAHVWDTSAVAQAEEAERSEFDDMLAEIGAAVGQALAAPTSSELVCDGQQGKFYRADARSLAAAAGEGGRLGSLFERLYEEDEDGARAAAPSDPIDAADAAFAELGFQHLGDMTCDRFGEVILRGYACPWGDAYGVYMVGTIGQTGWDFYTRLADGWSLTTTSMAEQGDVPSKRILRTPLPEIALAELWEAHRERLLAVSPEFGPPEPITPTLTGLAEAVDEFLGRYL